MTTPSLNEKALRERYPEIRWQEPVEIHVLGGVSRWVCRYCIALHGIKGHQVASSPFAFGSRLEALEHIEKNHYKEK